MTTMLRIALLACLTLISAFAQTVGASVQGAVTDPAGAVIPNASIEVRNTETGAVRTLNTDESGRWREPVLPPGDYQIRVSASGFQTMVRPGVHLTVGQEAIIDF